MTMVSLPNILFRVGKGRKLSDIEFLSIKEFDGKRADVSNIINYINSTLEIDLITYTVPAAKDGYLAFASLVGNYSNPVSPPVDITYRLYLNGVVEEEFTLEDVIAGEEWTHTFQTKSKKFTVGQIVKTTQQLSVAGNNAVRTSSRLTLWEEDTGDSPQIPSI